ncbi:cation:proton antiporter [Nocardioides coralli]|uniref:cation:proton antiporter domain-containing protein n=1 Tax=Nocardioides coralli TaxID=2872154 RepID=UPI001CA401DB|nr:cation:proton antiporter [Nocardioides coralli]QZY29098.1 cation:proton antiporter [Nocardioides coralli]
MPPLAAVAVVALLLVGYGLVSARLDAWSVTGPLVFTAAGLALGPTGAGVLGGDISTTTVEILAEATLVMVLFTDASRIHLRRLLGQLALPLRLLGVGLPLTLLLGTVAAVWLLADLGWWEAALLAAILTPTDAALGAAVVSDERVPSRVRQALNVESGLNDGLMVPILAVLVAGATAELEGRGVGGWLGLAGQQVGLGVIGGALVGYLGGLLLVRAHDRGWVHGDLRQLTTLGIGVTAWAAAEVVGGNGFVAAFVAGLAFGEAAREHCGMVADFAEEEGHLLSLLTFLLFGAVLLGPALLETTPGALAYAALSLTLVRMLPVAVSVLGVGLRAPTVGYLGWFGPRGLASILFTIVVVEEIGEGRSGELMTAASLVVAASILLHGLSAAPLASRYAAWFARVEPAADAPEAVPVPMMRVRAGGHVRGRGSTTAREGS